MASLASKSQMLQVGDIHHATARCISDFEACLSVKPLMKEGWAESRLADLNLWASGVGALATPNASLDRRLQFQPKPRLVLLNLLLTLQEFISSCRMYVLNETYEQKESTENKADSEAASVSPTEATLELPLSDNSNPPPSSTSWFAALAYSPKAASDTSSDSGIENRPDVPNFEVTLKKLTKDVDDILDQLIMLGFAIRKSGTVARLRKADSSFKPDENNDFKNYLEFILLNSPSRRQKNSEENTGNTIKKRMQEVTPEQQHLILANLRRRHRFRYARRHQQKLDQIRVNTLVTKPKLLVHTTEEHQETTPGLNRSPVSDDGESLPADDYSNKTPSAAPSKFLQAPEMSETTPSVAEDNILQIAMPMAVAASRVSVSVATMHYPSPPPVSQQMRGFKCPCCYQTLPEMFKDWSRWRKHLVEDLCPYTCPFPKCPRSEGLYITRAAWRDHVLQSHGVGYSWECLACVGTGIPNTFLSAQEFVNHNRTKHIDTISEDQVMVLRDTCRKIAPPNIAQCPLCPWPQDEKETPDAIANLEHVGNCIHEFSLNALPWAESLVTCIDAMDPLNLALREKVEEWLKSTEEEEGADIQKINIKMFGFFQTQPLPIKQEWEYIPEEYFAESSKESSVGERESLSLDSDLPEVRGTYSDDISDEASEKSERGQVIEDLHGSTVVEPPEHDANKAYTIGWITSTPIEFTAAKEFLENTHGEPQWVHWNDRNSYTLGEIEQHNVVIARMPRGVRVDGAGAAAIAATDMILSFPNVRVCLMVGIGGGAPSKSHEIRLGDVVVGVPSLPGKGGVIQYDYKTTTQTRRFQGIRYLCQPPKALMDIVTRLISRRKVGNNINTAISSILEKNRQLWRDYRRPDTDFDKLWSTDGAFKPGENFTLKFMQQAKRSEEKEEHVAIHYGLIASADGFIEDTQVRDKLAKELGVLCFETEAAGLMSSFPCLVIRGICDYSDGNWSEEWQGYAAMAAAAYAKELLCMLPLSYVNEMRVITGLA
ncbi:hypothetical protein V8C35DRAFT_285617 [Trichoderma chlorosporum]